jgi:serine/threonine-protein kinase HipA
MAVNGKFTDVLRDDMLAVADRFGVGTAPKVLKKVGNAISAWPEYAEKAEIGANEINRIRRHHRIL